MINPFSKKRRAQLPEYAKLISRLRELCNNRSELSGDVAGWQSNCLVEPHHIGGRTGHRFLDPFNIIMITRTEHAIEEGVIKGVKVGKEELLRIVREIRIGQGFKEING